ncbi:MAG: flagellar basal-body rod protein FlgG [Planctomycetota bacterium]
MAITALHTAATGLSALGTELDVIANNLANINTDGFKSSRVNFEDLIYQTKAQPGVENAIGDQRPMGTQVGLGVRVSNTQTDFSQGELVPTEQPLDLAIEGAGFFRVQILPDQADGFGYTRAGNFALNSDGDVVLGNADGPRLDPPINIDSTEYSSIEISNTGDVIGFGPGAIDGDNLGQIDLFTFVNPEGLEHIGGNLFVESVASGPSIGGQPGEGKLGLVRQGFLESSNVDPTIELVNLIKTQRAFEMNSKTIEAADQTLQTISNLRRF